MEAQKVLPSGNLHTYISEKIRYTIKAATKAKIA